MSEFTPQKWSLHTKIDKFLLTRIGSPKNGYLRVIFAKRSAWPLFPSFFFDTFPKLRVKNTHKKCIFHFLGVLLFLFWCFQVNNFIFKFLVCVQNDKYQVWSNVLCTLVKLIKELSFNQAHQWTGNLVTCAWWAELFISAFIFFIFLPLVLSELRRPFYLCLVSWGLLSEETFLSLLR